jgi:hypothetical protein
MRQTLRLGAVVLFTAYGLLAVSCGTGLREERLPETGASLEGTITYGDQKVELAMIIVTGSNSSATGNVDESTGRYKVENVPLGDVKIGVNTTAAKGDLQGKLMAGYYKGPEAKSKKIKPPKIVDVPAKFASPMTSGLTTKISSGPNEFNIEIPK